MDTLNGLAAECKHVTEFGVDEVGSTWAFLLAGRDHGVVIRSYDITRKKEVNNAEEVARKEGVDWTFTNVDVLKTEIDETDLLFIDDNHAHDHIVRELERHAGKVRRYIAFHDTKLIGDVNRAVEDFKQAHHEFVEVYRTDEMCGLVVLKRRNEHASSDQMGIPGPQNPEK